jgi:hypothetical protein
MKEVNILIIAYEKIMIRIHMIAFLIVEDGVFCELSTLIMYLYPAYIMNIVQTTSPN